MYHKKENLIKKHVSSNWINWYANINPLKWGSIGTKSYYVKIMTLNGRIDSGYAYEFDWKKQDCADEIIAFKFMNIID